MGSGRNLPLYAWPGDKLRLQEMQRRMQEAADNADGHTVVMGEVIHKLLDEHDRALETETA